jgi:hypothetical protein
MNDRCGEIREMLEEMLHGELSGDALAAVEEHLAGCAGCRDYREALEEDDRLLDGLTRSMDLRIERLEERVMGSIEKREKKVTIGWPARIVIAAAAALVLIIGWNVIFTGGEDVVWAKVIEQVREAQDFICRIERTAVPWDDTEQIAYHSKKYGQKKALYIDGKLAAEVFVKPGEKKIHLLHHKDEAYVTIGLTSRDARGLTDMTSAQDMVEYFHSFDYKEIGTRRIEGSDAVGIEITDPALWAGDYEEGSVRLWVDASTWWPVLIEREFSSDSGKVRISEVLKDFQWNPVLSKKDFQFEVPDHYGTMDFGETHDDEKGAIEGLRAYAKLTGGRYPGDPAFDTAASEMRADRDRLQEKGEWGPEDIKEFFKIRGLSVFYSSLVEDGVEVEYFGSTVRATDFDKVLMRWRLDDGRWRVIYGDLRAETIEAE